jgi:hypothetical protein
MFRVGLKEPLLLLASSLGFGNSSIHDGSRSGSKHGSRVDGIQHVHIPDLDRRVHCSHSNKVSESRRFTLGSISTSRSVRREVKPLDTERPATQHEVVVNVKVVVRFVVDVVVEGGEVGGGSGSDNDRVGREDLEGFSVNILFFGLSDYNSLN